MTTPAPALLIAGHGTRDDAGAETFRDLVRELGRRDPGLPGAGGFIEFSPPPAHGTEQHPGTAYTYGRPSGPRPVPEPEPFDLVLDCHRQTVQHHHDDHAHSHAH